MAKDAETPPAQSAGNLGIALHRPALGAPSRAGVEQGHGPRSTRSKQRVAPGFGGRVDRKKRRNRRECIAGNRRSQFNILFDHVCAMSGHALRIENPRWTFARRFLANNPLAAGHAPQNRRAQRTLHIDDRVVRNGLEPIA